MDIDFEITHLCNKHCPSCSHRIDTSDFTYVTLEEMKEVLDCFSIPEIVSNILIIGGEPLCHPHYKRIIRMIEKKFRNSRIIISTNGKLLPKVPKEFLERYIWRISRYPGWNDEICDKYKKFKNVQVLGFGGWWNPDQDPNLTLEQAKKVEKVCFHQYRIIGTNLYRCCLSEGVERAFKTKPVHVKMTKNFLQDWKKIPVEYACQHCFKANEVYLKSKTDSKKQGRCMNHGSGKVEDFKYEKWKQQFNQKGRFHHVD